MIRRHALTCLVLLAATLALPVAPAAAAPREGRSLAVLDLLLAGGPAPSSGPTADRLGDLVAPLARVRRLSSEDAHKRLEHKIVVPLRRANAERLRAIEQLVAQGDELLYTDPRAAIPVLDRAKKELEEILLGIALDEKVRGELFRTQMLLARSHLDNGDSKAATKVCEELIRTFGEREDVTEENYHPKLVSLYRKTADRLASQRTGTLQVTSEPPGLEVLVNGRVVATKTPITVPKLLPGSYNVQVRRDEENESLIHRIAVPANGTGSVTIDLAFDNAVTVTSENIGLTVDSGRPLEGQPTEYAARLGTELGVDEILLAAVVPGERGRGELRALRIDVASRTVMEQVALPVAASGPRDDQLVLAAQVLCNLVEPPPPGQDVAVTAPHAGSPWYTDWLGWTLVGVGTACVATGGYFFWDYGDKKDCAGDPSCGDQGYRTRQADAALDSRNWAWGLTGVGAAAIVGGIVVFALHDEGSPAATTAYVPLLTPVALPGGGALSWQGRF